MEKKSSQMQADLWFLSFSSTLIPRFPHFFYFCIAMMPLRITPAQSCLFVLTFSGAFCFFIVRGAARERFNDLPSPMLHSHDALQVTKVYASSSNERAGIAVFTFRFWLSKFHWSSALTSISISSIACSSILTEIEMLYRKTLRRPMKVSSACIHWHPLQLTLSRPSVGFNWKILHCFTRQSRKNISFTPKRMCSVTMSLRGLWSGFHASDRY